MKRLSVTLAMVMVMALALTSAWAVAPQQVMIGDGARPVTVKAASTAPAAADRALVVSISPNGLGTAGASSAAVMTVQGIANGTVVPVTFVSTDPCQNPNKAKSSAIINVGAATTTKIVDTDGTKTVYLCSFVATLAGTTPTVKFVTGTNTAADCDTGAADASGAFAPTAGSVLSMGAGSTLVQSGAGGQVCATTTGAGSSFQGIATYVQG